MSTITKERIELFIKSPLENGLTRGEQMELARIALASLAAEPVAKIIAHYPLGVDVGKQKFVQAIRELPDFGGYLFAAPPAPIVPEEMYWQDAPVEGSSKAAAYATGWNDCREAMLQSGNFRENKDSSTNNFRKIPEASTSSPVTPDGWISCSDRMPEDTKMLLAFSQGEIVAAYWNWVVNPIDYKKYRAFTYLSGYILDDVTHWMPLPEPPKGAK
ncbi:DUF551 domain-containing protein [Escherichia coli]|uniref:DUF551 domain-containing protein n=1 Tax=Escherichia coli TaxID=562 RepID=UPI0011CA7CD2|nr:DUF551 domain-containing protein [Escherichia coli]TXP27003.1 DUF551 domain-containing protein [Escherichia coli]